MKRQLIAALSIFALMMAVILWFAPSRFWEINGMPWMAAHAHGNLK